MEGNKIEVPIEVQSIGKNKMFLHIELGTGTLGKRKVRLLQDTGGSNLIFQVYSLDGKSWDSYGITPEAISKCFSDAVQKFEKNPKLKE